MFNGIILIDKPSGISSFGVVARVRGRLSALASRRVKVGHTGTLDPFATGLLILVIGDYCKRASEFSKLDKTYQATVRLGQKSSTGDPEGEITDVSTVKPALAEITAILPTFTGVIQQTPPIYSAIKIDGQRAYKLARQGQEVVMPTREVTVYSLEITEYTYPFLRITCQVSSGTYIRTLAQDIGTALGTGAYPTELRRTKVADWLVTDAKDIDAIAASDILTLPALAPE